MASLPARTALFVTLLIGIGMTVAAPSIPFDDDLAIDEPESVVRLDGPLHVCPMTGSAAAAGGRSLDAILSAPRHRDHHRDHHRDQWRTIAKSEPTPAMCPIPDAVLRKLGQRLPVISGADQSRLKG